MAAYSYRNIFSGSLVSNIQLESDAIYDDVLDGYVYDDGIIGSITITDDNSVDPAVQILDRALTLNGIPLTSNGLILSYLANTIPGVIVGPTLKELVFTISSATPIPDANTVTLGALTFSIVNATPISNSNIVLQPLSFRIVPSVSLNELYLTKD